MTEQVLIQLVRDTLLLAFVTAAPLLGVALAIGLSISIFQVVTSIQDITLTFIPKMLGVCLLTLFLLPWIVDLVSGFAIRLLSQIAVHSQ